MSTNVRQILGAGFGWVSWKTNFKSDCRISCLRDIDIKLKKEVLKMKLEIRINSKIEILSDS